MSSKVAITWTWHCLGTGRTTCSAGGEGVKGLARHMETTLHGTVMRGVPG